MRFLPAREIERWVGVVRLLAVPFAIGQVAASPDYPPGYAAYAWTTATVFSVGAVALFFASRLDLGHRGQTLLGAAALGFDTVTVSSFVLIFHYQAGTPVGRLLLLLVVEAALRYGMAGALALAVAVTPVQASGCPRATPTTARMTSRA